MTGEECLLPCILPARLIAFMTNLARESGAFSLRAETTVFETATAIYCFLTPGLSLAMFI